MTEPRDRVVESALGRIPTPDHRDDFWERLENRLDDETLVPLKRARRYGARQRILSAAAAVALLGGVTVALALRDAPERRAVVADAPTTATTPPNDDPASPGAATADGVVRQWIAALGKGDSAAAAALVGPRSRRYVESLGGNLEGFMTESQEGHGGWAASPELSTTEIELGQVDGVAITVVVVSGEWKGEGDETFRTDAYPTVRSTDGWLIEPMAFLPHNGERLALTSPAGDAPLAPDSVISATAPGSGDFYFSLNDNTPVRVGGVQRSGEATASWDPPGRLPAQSHLLVVTYIDGDTLTAVAKSVRVR